MTSPPRSAAGTSTQRCSRGGGQHRLDDLRGAQAVGEQRHAVRRAPRRARRRGRRRRTGRSSRRSPAGGPAGRNESRAASGLIPAMSRGTSVDAVAAARSTASRAPPGRRSRPRCAPSTSSQRRFLRPGEIWLMTVLPIAPPSVSNCTTAASSVSTARFSPPPLPRANAARVLGVEALGHRGERAGAEAGDPLAGDELGEVAPVRADVGERARGAAERRVDAPVVVLGVGQPVLQVGAVDEPDRAGGAGAHAVAGLADRRVVAVDERDGGGGAGRGGRVDEALRRRRRRSRAASRRSTCLPAARAASASGRCRWLGVQMCTTSTSGDSTSSSEVAKARSAPSARAASSERDGRGCGDADDARAGQPGGAGVDGADEAGAGDRDSEVRAAMARRNRTARL